LATKRSVNHLKFSGLLGYIYRAGHSVSTLINTSAELNIASLSTSLFLSESEAADYLSISKKTPQR